MERPVGLEPSGVQLARFEPKVTDVSAETSSELAVLKEKLLTMAGYAETAVNRAVKALIRRDDDLARRTREEDELIDALELEIDGIALRLLEKRPNGIDLRFITMAMKISSNLERVGDEATTISRRVLELSQEPQLPQAEEVPRIAALAVPMLKEALDAFVQGDPASARLLIPRDEQVDALNARVQKELAVLMAQRPSAISRCLNLMVICKSLERVGDHATNVAEEVVYLYEGQDIRHVEPGDEVRSASLPDRQSGNSISQ